MQSPKIPVFGPRYLNFNMITFLEHCLKKISCLSDLISSEIRILCDISLCANHVEVLSFLI